MKTFIWNREYEVVAANAETIEQARKMLKPKLDELLDPDLKEVIEQSIEYAKKHPSPEGEDPRYYRDEAWWKRNIEWTRNDIKRQKSIIRRKPDVIIEENQAIIFWHTNP